MAANVFLEGFRPHFKCTIALHAIAARWRVLVVVGKCDNMAKKSQVRLYSTQDLFLSTFVPGDSKLWHKAKAG